MDPLEVIACGMLGAIIGVIAIVAVWQFLKFIFPILRKIDLL